MKGVYCDVFYTTHSISVLGKEAKSWFTHEFKFIRPKGVANRAKRYCVSASGSNYIMIDLEAFRPTILQADRPLKNTRVESR